MGDVEPGQVWRCSTLEGHGPFEEAYYVTVDHVVEEVASLGSTSTVVRWRCFSVELERLVTTSLGYATAGVAWERIA